MNDKHSIFDVVFYRFGKVGIRARELIREVCTANYVERKLESRSHTFADLNAIRFSR